MVIKIPAGLMGSCCYLLSILFSSTLFAYALCENSSDLISSCLRDHGITNFTLYPSSSSAGGDDGSSDYFRYLDFSVQNLRFRGPSVPKPIAIVIPETKQQLVNSLLCSRKGPWEIRLRCGGHSYEGTSSVAPDGSPFVLIDMMNLNRISVDLENEMAWVEGGATLGQTYYAISQSSNAHGFSAGSCPTVGIGGHIAGGGFGLLSRKHGLAADNVVDAILVDAEGRELNRESMGEDVFWAIRGGGGGNWGIVYAWKIKLLKVPKTVTAFIVSRPGSKQYLSDLVHKWQNVGPNLDDSFYLSAFLGAGLPQAKTIGELSATFKGFYLGSRNRALSIVNRVFPELAITGEDCKEMSWIESIVCFSGLDDGSSISDLKDRYLKEKLYFKAKSDYVRNPIPARGIRDGLLENLEKQPKGYVILDPYGGEMWRISNKSIAFPHRKGNLYSIQYMVEWKEEDVAKHEGYIEWIRGFYESMASYVSRNPRSAYVNYMDFDLGEMGLLNGRNAEAPPSDAVERARVWGEKYFLQNYDRLVKAKTVIDPFNVFRHEQSIPPAASILWPVKEALPGAHQDQ